MNDDTRVLASWDRSTATTMKMDLAIDRLLAGDTVVAAARAARVDRTTVHRWIRHDPAFRAELQRRGEENRTRRRLRMEALGDRAIDNIAKKVRAGDVPVSQWVLERGDRLERTVYARRDALVSLLMDVYDRTGRAVLEADADEEEDGGEDEGSLGQDEESPAEE